MDFPLPLLLILFLTYIMITNIIKNLIKDLPSVANSKFDSSTAAILAYTRGYLGGMDANNRYEQEGTEALGLQVLPDTDLVD